MDTHMCMNTHTLELKVGDLSEVVGTGLLGYTSYSRHIVLFS